MVVNQRGGFASACRASTTRIQTIESVTGKSAGRGRSETTAIAPRLAASATNWVPIDARAGRRDEYAPRRHPARIVRDD